MSDWHLMDLKCQKLVVQFLTYSNIPWSLKSGFVTMNINTFLAVSGIPYQNVAEYIIM